MAGAGGRPIGSGTYGRQDLLRMAIGAAAVIWRERSQRPTLQRVATSLGYSRGGLSGAFLRLGISWPDVWNAGRRQSFGDITRHIRP